MRAMRKYKVKCESVIIPLEYLDQAMQLRLP